MNFWHLILWILRALSVLSAGFITVRIHRFSALKRLGQSHGLLAWLIAALPVCLLGLFARTNLFTLMIVLIHLLLGFLLCDLAALLLKKAAKKSVSLDARNLAAIVLTTVYLGAGWFFAHHVFLTTYSVDTQKDVGEGLRIVEIADLHLGSTLDGEGFARQLARVQALQPDVVAITGDFVDDDTDRQALLTACSALGRLETAYGVFFVCGNHDNGYFSYRNFTAGELRSALTDNGVTILEDESVLIDDRFYIVGRQDRSVRRRMAADALTAGLDRSKFILLLDHQPNDYANEAASGADLVLSGHTHGGHLFPAGLIGLAAGANDKVYGIEKRDGTVFVVSSGISGWAIPFKTGAISELVVIDVRTTAAQASAPNADERGSTDGR